MAPPRDIEGWGGAGGESLHSGAVMKSGNAARGLSASLTPTAARDEASHLKVWLWSGKDR